MSQSPKNYNGLRFVYNVIERHRRRKRPTETVSGGNRLIVFPEVFSPFIAPSGRIGLQFASWPIFKDKIVLELGCGSGAISCLMALNGAKRVVGVDRNAHAVCNAKVNAARLDLQTQVEFRRGDLFDGINEAFDIIYADLPFVSGWPKDRLEQAFFEPGLKSLHRCIQQLPCRLTRPGARAYICCSNLDGLELLDKIRTLDLKHNIVMKIKTNLIYLYLVEIAKSKN